jgi:hypothetical protein
MHVLIKSVKNSCCRGKTMNKVVTLKRLNVVVFSLLLVGQPTCAGIGETFCTLKERANSTTSTLLVLGATCCGLAYWNVRLQQRQAVLEKSIAHEKAQRRQLKKEVLDLAERSDVQGEGLLVLGGGLTEIQKECDERLKPIELALYGFGADHSRQTFRLTCLAKMIETQSRIDTGVMGKIQFNDSDEPVLDASASQSSIHQSDNDTPQGGFANDTPDSTLALRGAEVSQNPAAGGWFSRIFG